MSDYLSTPASYIVIGAGPVGLAAALLLAQQGHTVVVFEGRDTLPLHVRESYPIGLNPRGRATLRAISPDLDDVLAADGRMIASWRIVARGRTLSELPSGTVLGTTRAQVNGALFEETHKYPQLTVRFGCKLQGLDLATRHLVFSRSDGERVTVDASMSRVIAADGVWSQARQALATQRPDLAPEVGDWGVSFRVLLSKPGATAPELDPTQHTIFVEKGLYTATLADGQWCLNVTAIDGDPDAHLLLADEATTANVGALKRYVAAHAPQAVPLFDDDDYARFFSSRSFGGAVVRAPALHAGEWLVLVGDAAHSVIPPTGEGINSGLEDARLLCALLAEGITEPFARYNAARLPDLYALGEYAWFLMEGVRSTDPARKLAQTIFRILSGVAKRLHLVGDTVEARLFGPDAGTAPYREVLGPWLRRRDRWFPTLYWVARQLTRLRQPSAPHHRWSQVPGM